MNSAFSRPPPEAGKTAVDRVELGDIATSSPELAIKMAYDIGRSLRAKGAQVADLPALVTIHIDEPLAEAKVRAYARAGFIAGFHHGPLPWRREVEAGPT